MSSIDFTQFKAPDAINKKKPGGLPSKTQNYEDLKYRKAVNKKDNSVTTKFTVSDARFESLQLKSNEFLAVIHPTTKQVLIGVVAEGHGNLLRKREGREKGQAFKSDTIEAALLASGVIVDAPVGTNQYVKMTQVGTSQVLEKEMCSVIFLLEKGAPKAKEAKEVKEEAPVAAKTEEPTKAAEPQAQAAPVAASSDDEWN